LAGSQPQSDRARRPGRQRQDALAIAWLEKADVASDVHTIVKDLGLRHPAIIDLRMAGPSPSSRRLIIRPTSGRLVLVDTLPGILEEFTAIRDAQIVYIDAHTCVRSLKNVWPSLSPKARIPKRRDGWWKLRVW
jgi:hypothetical protein